MTSNIASSSNPSIQHATTDEGKSGSTHARAHIGPELGRTSSGRSIHDVTFFELSESNKILNRPSTIIALHPPVGRGAGTRAYEGSPGPNPVPAFAIASAKKPVLAAEGAVKQQWQRQVSHLEPGRQWYSQAERTRANPDDLPYSSEQRKNSVLNSIEFAKDTPEAFQKSLRAVVAQTPAREMHDADETFPIRKFYFSHMPVAAYGYWLNYELKNVHGKNYELNKERVSATKVDVSITAPVQFRADSGALPIAQPPPHPIVTKTLEHSDTITALPVALDSFENMRELVDRLRDFPEKDFKGFMSSLDGQIVILTRKFNMYARPLPAQLVPLILAAAFDEPETFAKAALTCNLSTLEMLTQLHDKECPPITDRCLLAALTAACSHVVQGDEDSLEEPTVRSIHIMHAYLHLLEGVRQKEENT